MKVHAKELALNQNGRKIKMKSNYKSTIIKLSVIVLAAGTSFACTFTTDHKNDTVRETDAIAKPVSKPPSSFTDTLSINSVAAVFYTPDSIQLEKIKAANKKEIFESMSHEYFFQMNNARLLIKRDWPKIKIIECSKFRYLLFIKKNGTKTCIDLNTKNDMSGIILFDGQQSPEFADMMNIDSDLGFYFKK